MPQRGENMKASIKITPGVTMLIIHTHPMRSGPRPSPADIAITVSTGITDLVISDHREFIVWPNGVIDEMRP